MSKHSNKFPPRSNAKRSDQHNGDGHFRSPRPASKASFHNTNGRSRVNSSAIAAADSSEDDHVPTTKHSRSGSTGSKASKASSRPTSRLSRKRASSNTAPSSTAGQEEKEKEGGERSRRMSVAGWASSAVESVTGGKSKKSKDKDSFTSLEDSAMNNVADRPDEDAGAVRKSGSFQALTRRTSKNKSKENLPTDSPSLSTKILKPPSLQDKKVVRAIYDFSGSSDELSFKAGSNIIVVHEVLDDWWMGELDGQRGLFPTSYTEVIGSKPDPSSKNGNTNYNTAVPIVVRTMEDDSDQDPYLTSDADDEQILRATPMPANKSPVFYGGFNDSASFTGSMVDDEEESKAQPLIIPQRVPLPDASGDWFSDQPQRPWHYMQPATPLPPSRRSILRSLDPANQPLINRSVSEMPVSTSPTNTKKVPPPPPPRRTVSHNPSLGPPIPERKTPAFGFSSQPALHVTPPSSVASHSSYGYDRSPFDSAIELEVEAVKCERFRQNPFKPKGMCSNCLEFHD